MERSTSSWRIDDRSSVGSDDTTSNKNLKLNP